MQHGLDTTIEERRKQSGTILKESRQGPPSKGRLSRARFGIALLVLVISMVTFPQSVEAAGPVHIGVVCSGCPPGGPVPASATFHITFYTDVGYDGHITIYDRPSGSSTHIWDSGSIAIFGGLAYDVVPPPISMPGNYVAGGLFYPNGGGVDLGETSFVVVGSGSPSTDWAVLSVSWTPFSPQPSDSVLFHMQMTALSTSAAFPQTVNVQSLIDGVSYGSGAFSYPGPVGTPASVSTETPWVATPGTHVLTWSIDTTGDPNPSNNVMSESFTVSAPAPFDFFISVSPTQQSVVLGGSTSYAVDVALLSGTPQSVSLSLSGAPPGASEAFSPSSGMPGFTSTLSISTTSSASVGTYPLTITGSGGGVSHSVNIVLIVTQAPDFQISVTPPSQSALQGQTVSFSVNVATLNGFNSPVSLTISGLPLGVDGTFSTPSGTPNFGSTLAVTLSSSASTGSFTLTVTGTGGGTSHVANIILVINSAPQTQTSSTSQTTQASATQTSSPPGLSDIMSFLQSNMLLLLGGLVAILLLTAIVSRARRKPSGAAAAQASKAGTVYCKQCGNPNPAANEYCGKCGTRL